MFTLCPFNSAIVSNFPSIFAHMYLCGMHYQWFWLNLCKGNSFGDIKAINCDNGCRGPYKTGAWPRSMHEPSIHRDKSSVRWWSPAARTSPIGSSQVWRLHDVGLLPRTFMFRRGLLREQIPRPTSQKSKLISYSNFWIICWLKKIPRNEIFKIEGQRSRLRGYRVTSTLKRL